MRHTDYSKYSLLPGSREAAIWTLKRAWQLGDTDRVSEWLGIKYIPTPPPPGLDLDEEWAFAVADVRRWIEDIYHRLYEPVHA